jgi:excinuclease UvrABC nuclease subunit
VNAERVGDADIFALGAKGGAMCIQSFFIRGGQNWGARSFFPAHTHDVPEEEVLSSFLVQFYEEVPPRMKKAWMHIAPPLAPSAKMSASPTRSAFTAWLPWM